VPSGLGDVASEVLAKGVGVNDDVRLATAETGRVLSRNESSFPATMAEVTMTKMNARARIKYL
jgi:hypothetical protein